MSALNHLKDYRVVKANLPLAEGGQQRLDGVAKVTSPPQFEINFLPDQLTPDTLNTEEFALISFDVAGENRSIKARLGESPAAGKLLLEMVDSYTYAQKREYFRVDADLSVSYWVIDDENPSAQAVETTVNISGGGMRLPVSESVPEGTRMGLEIAIDEPQPAVVECVGEVVGNYEDSGRRQLALKFTDIEEEHQDAIIGYCLAEQRKQLRLKVKVLGTGAAED